MNLIRRPFRYHSNNYVFVIIGINVLVYLAEMFIKQVPVYFYLSLSPVAIMHGWIWQFVTYMFVHDPQSIIHIIFNMLALFIFGPPVERQMGSREFLLYYLLTGILAGFFSFVVYVVTGTWNVLLLGASGAIFAVQLAYAVLFPRSKIYIWGILPLRAPVMVLGFTALELVSMIGGFTGGISHLTHLVGFAIGWIYFLLRFGINPWRAMRS